MIREISNLNRVQLIQQRLQQAPKGINNMLHHVLERYSSQLNEEESTQINSILEWVATAVRPLSLANIEQMLCLSEKNDHSDEHVVEQEASGFLGLDDDLRLKYASFFSLTSLNYVEPAAIELFRDLDAHDEATEFRSPNYIAADESSKDVHRENVQVSFCHASIGDFFRSRTEETLISVGTNHPTVGLDMVQARIKVLRSSLRLICGEIQTTEYGASFTKYVCATWEAQLRNLLIDLDLIAAEDRAEIGRLLFLTHTDENCISVRISLNSDIMDFYVAWRSFTTWFNDEKSKDKLESNQRIWIEAATLDMKIWADPLMQVLGKHWLCTRLPDYKISTSRIRQIFLITSGQTERDYDTWEDIASRFGFERDALWHERFALTLSDHHWVSKSSPVPFFEKAVSLDPTRWDSRTKLAKWKQVDGNIEGAIKMLEDNIRRMQTEVGEYTASLRSSLEILQVRQHIRGHPLMFPKVLREEFNDACRELSTVYIETKNFQKAYYWSHLCAKSDPTYVNLSLFLQCAWSFEGPPADILETFKLLQSKKGQQNDNALIDALWEEPMYDQAIFMVVNNACTAVADIEWLKSMYISAISSARKERNPRIFLSLTVCLAELHYRTKHCDEALRLWEQVLFLTGDIWSQQTGGIGLQEKTRVKDRYWQLLLRMSQDTGACSLAAAKYQDTLLTTWATRGELIGPNRAAAYMATLYNTAGLSSKALRFAAPSIKRLIGVLRSDKSLASHDDQYEQDVSDSWFELAHLLAGLGDLVRATCVFQTMRWRLDIDVQVACDVCDRVFEPQDIINICRLCWVDVCDGCKDRPATLSAPASVCNSKSTWVPMPTVTNWTCGEGETMCGGKAVSFKEILDRLMGDIGG